MTLLTETLVNQLTGGYWVPVLDGDPRLVDLYMRHYSARRSKATRQDRIRHGISGPFESVAYITTDGTAGWMWRRANIERDDHQEGVECNFFRNEGSVLSSTLIQEADALAWALWPGERHFTYVEDGEIDSPNPGYCYKMAGWKHAGRNKDGRLTILELLP